VVEHSDGRTERVSLWPNRSVGEVSRELLGALDAMTGGVHINPMPQEVAWTDRLDEDEAHRTYDPDQVAAYFAVATQVALVLAEIRAPYRGRSSPVNAWWGSFDLAVSLYSGRGADPAATDFISRNAGSAQQIEIGWWPGDARYPKAAFFGFATPAPEGFSGGSLSSASGSWNEALGEFVLDWDDVIASSTPHADAVRFGRSVVAHACSVCEWDADLAASSQGIPPPVN
jgi:hypothetical protein